jgi:flagellar hook assembly protein FlgD
MEKILNFFYNVTEVNESELEHIPNKVFLSQNYPNPFNPTTTIQYSVPTSSVISNPSKASGERSPSSVSGHLNLETHGHASVLIIVYDILGREIKTLVNQQQNPGEYSVQFDGSNLPSGIYYYSLYTSKFSETKKLILLK